MTRLHMGYYSALETLIPMMGHLRYASALRAVQTAPNEAAARKVAKQILEAWEDAQLAKRFKN